MKQKFIARDLHNKLIEDYNLKNDPESNAGVRLLILQALEQNKDLTATPLRKALASLMGCGIYPYSQSHMQMYPTRQAIEEAELALSQSGEVSDPTPSPASLDLEAIEAALKIADRRTNAFDNAWAALSRLRSLQSTKALEWTKEKPTKPGFYFYEFATSLGTCQILSPPFKGFLFDTEHVNEKMRGIIFAGPIPEPQSPPPPMTGGDQ
jgi:hypothetical protein